LRRMAMARTLVVARHGTATYWQVNNLSDEGVRQATSLGLVLRAKYTAGEKTRAVVVSSPTRRALSTASLIAAIVGDCLVIIESCLDNSRGFPSTELLADITAIISGYSACYDTVIIVGHSQHVETIPAQFGNYSSLEVGNGQAVVINLDDQTCSLLVPAS